MRNITEKYLNLYFANKNIVHLQSIYIECSERIFVNKKKITWKKFKNEKPTLSKSMFYNFNIAVHNIDGNKQTEFSERNSLEQSANTNEQIHLDSWTIFLRVELLGEFPYEI